MRDINNLILEARLCKDAEVLEYTTAEGAKKKMAKLYVASHKPYVKEGEDDSWFFNITSFNVPEGLLPYLTSGSLVLIEGHITQEAWQDENGNKKTNVGIIADFVKLVKQPQAQQTQQAPAQAPVQQAQQAQAPVQPVAPVQQAQAQAPVQPVAPVAPVQPVAQAPIQQAQAPVAPPVQPVVQNEQAAFQSLFV